MAQLYTSLVRVKQAMNGGALPPMTPLSETALKIVSPEHTIGMGAIIEDEERGLQCPVRGCGEWYQCLTKHLNWRHAEVGGADGVKEALSIPRNTRLSSARSRERNSAASRLLMAKGVVRPFSADAARRGRAVAKTQGAATFSSTMRTVNRKNFKDQCEAQLANKLVDLHLKLGRSPSIREARQIYGEAFVKPVLNLYGTWNNALLQQGYEVHARRTFKYSPGDIIEMFRVYHEVRGCLPSVTQAYNPTVTPLLPSRSAVYRALGVNGWPEAMAEVARRLRISDHRYAA